MYMYHCLICCTHPIVGGERLNIACEYGGGHDDVFAGNGGDCVGDWDNDA